jgi:hypothetical protein
VPFSRGMGGGRKPPYVTEITIVKLDSGPVEKVFLQEHYDMRDCMYKYVMDDK